MTSESARTKSWEGGLVLSLGLVGAATILGLALVGANPAASESPSSSPESQAAELVPDREGRNQLELRKSPIPGVIDIYRGDQLLQNVVPLVTWREGGRDFYNNAEIQGSEVKLTTIAGGYLLRYEPFNRPERVDGAAPQPASHVELAVLVEQDDGSLRFSPVVLSNPVGHDVELGLGHFFGIYHGTVAASLEGGPWAGPFEPGKITGRGEYFTLGDWHQFAEVEAVRLISNDASKPTLRLALAGCSGRLDLEVRSDPWVPQMAAERGLSSWIEAVILYGPVTCFPMAFEVLPPG